MSPEATRNAQSEPDELDGAIEEAAAEHRRVDERVRVASDALRAVASPEMYHAYLAAEAAANAAWNNTLDRIRLELMRAVPRYRNTVYAIFSREISGPNPESWPPVDPFYPLRPVPDDEAQGVV